MINELINYFKDKKILILGFGREGKSTYKLIRKYLKTQKLFIADKKEYFQNENDFLKEDKNVEFIFGEKYLEGLENYDIIMKSPGISFVTVDTEKIKDKIKSELELLLEFFDVKTIGITGTKGKSTTSSLIYKVLKDQGKNVMLLGNIGVPVFDYIDTLKKDMYLVLEMSSHQLEFMKKSPNISILLNIYPEHLDHYKSFEDYALAKCNIFKYQKNNDYLLYNCDEDLLNNYTKNAKENVLKVSMKNNKADIYLDGNKVIFNNKEIYDSNEKRNLLGDYNLNNIMFVLGVSEIIGLDNEKTRKSINEFKTLNHRLEFVGKFNDVLYYDNSIATIPVATIEAIKALKDVDTLIIGGMDRGIDYSEFIKYLNNSNISNLICMPKTGHDIANQILDKSRVNIVETMEEAVSIAIKKTHKNKICLLSPAAASYGFFKNFEEKGDIYQKLVKEKTIDKNKKLC